MKWISFKTDNTVRLGLFDPSCTRVMDVSSLAAQGPADMLALIRAGSNAAAELARTAFKKAKVYELQNIQLLAPIPRPHKNIVCIGKNYREHINELNHATLTLDDHTHPPEAPIFFTKAVTSVIGPGEAIPAYLDPSQSCDYEGELALIIGQKARSIEAADAMRHVFGFTLINDVTARRLQKLHQQWFLSKSLDGFCPMGPCIVTSDDIEDVDALHIETYVNGELRQQADIRAMIYSIPQIIATLSRSMTLEAGDIIATGTPAGVGMGFTPPRFLHTGDRVEIRMEPIGILANPVL